MKPESSSRPSSTELLLHINECQSAIEKINETYDKIEIIETLRNKNIKYLDKIAECIL